jgi:O-antigen biosynthesis protein
MSFVSYARNCEDVLLWRALRDVAKGFYVDIGASDPEVASTTRAFYERGWFGINVQPVDEYYQRLVESRPRDRNLKVAVGREAGLRTLPTHFGNRFPDRNLGNRRENGAAVEAVAATVVPVRPLTQLIEESALSPIHFLKIDVKGDQVDVLEGLDLQRVRPWIILVGAINSDSTISPREEWEHLITTRGYSFAYFDGLNCFYVADEIPKAKERLAPPGLVDDFVRSEGPLWDPRAPSVESDLANLRIYSIGLETGLKEASIQKARLEKMVAAARFEAARLHKALQSERVTVDHLLGRIKQFESFSDRPLVARVHRLFIRLRDAGNRATGGGLRAIVKRMAGGQNLNLSPGSDPVTGLADYVLDRRLLSPVSEERTRYNRWVAVYDTMSDLYRSLIRAHISSLAFCPLISIVLTTAAKSGLAVADSCKSVFAQLYGNWELCLAVDAVAAPQIKAVLGSSEVRDPRIKLVRTDSLLSSAAANNAALNLAEGEFVAFLRAGDILPEQALYEAAFALGGTKRIDILYTDHDQVNPDGQRSDPWFKPGWDPDLLLAQDYISDLAVYRRSLVEAVGRLRPELTGAEFYDLALRATAATRAERVLHVPAILYHRYSEKQTTRPEMALPGLRTTRAAHRAVREHLDALGNWKAQLRPAPQAPSAHRVIWPIPEPAPLVSVIIPTRDRSDHLEQCVEGVLHRTDYSNIELLIVDNGSTEPATVAFLDRLTREEHRVRILRLPGPFNYSVLNNAAARAANGEVLLLLNNDIDVIESGWLREMVSQALRPDVGIVGAKLIYTDETIQHGGVVLGPRGQITHLHRFASRNDPGYRGQLSLCRTLSAVTGACVAIRRTVFFEVGGFDEINLQVGFNDIDLCLRLRELGYRVVWTPFAELFHVESVSRGYDDFPELFQLQSVFCEYKNADPLKRQRGVREWEHMHQTWGAMLEAGDPFHNPNLLFEWDHLELPSAPRRLMTWRIEDRSSGVPVVTGVQEHATD